MGGLFVRKVGGAASLAVQLQKLLPLLFHPLGAQWKRGHFRPVFATALFANILLATFYGIYISEELAAVGADGLPKIFLGILLFETIVILGYLATASKYTKGPAVSMHEGRSGAGSWFGGCHVQVGSCSGILHTTQVDTMP